MTQTSFLFFLLLLVVPLVSALLVDERNGTFPARPLPFMSIIAVDLNLVGSIQAALLCVCGTEQVQSFSVCVCACDREIILGLSTCNNSSQA